MMMVVVVMVMTTTTMMMLAFRRSHVLVVATVNAFAETVKNGEGSHDPKVLAMLD